MNVRARPQRRLEPGIAGGCELGAAGVSGRQLSLEPSGDGGAPHLQAGLDARRDAAHPDVVTYGFAEFQRDVSVSRETREALETHLNLLETWNKSHNLVGPGELADYWRRHALDSAQLLDLAPEARLWLDLGAGAGFPGLIVAARLIGVAGARVDLVEANQKKAAFLRAAILAMAAPARVLPHRAEALAKDAESYDIVTARAFAPLPRLLELAAPWLDRGATGLFLKGEGAAAELAEAGGSWALRTQISPSRSDPRGRVVRVDGVKRG